MLRVYDRPPNPHHGQARAKCAMYQIVSASEKVGLDAGHLEGDDKVRGGMTEECFFGPTICIS